MSSAMEEIFRNAALAGASDVHMTANSQPFMRICGELVLMNFPPLSATDTLDAVLLLMNEAQRERFEEKGEYDVSFSIPDVARYRVMAYKQKGQVAICARILPGEIPSPEKLGLDKAILSLCEMKEGLALFTGPGGSGKTTTLAALVDKINSEQSKLILTLESPVEYMYDKKISMVNQRDIGLDSDSFCSAMKAALRGDADVIALGDVPDYETLELMITAVETGRLVFAELPAADASGAVEKLSEICPAQDRQVLKARMGKIPFAVVAQKMSYNKGSNKVGVQYKFLQNKLWKKEPGEGNQGRGI